jgi:hypothetical protein
MSLCSINIRFVTKGQGLVEQGWEIGPAKSRRPVNDPSTRNIVPVERISYLRSDSQSDNVPEHSTEDVSG